MTGMQMAFWGAWSRRSQREFQVVCATALFAGLALGPHVVALVSGRPRDFVAVTLTAAVGAGLMYLFAGRHWRNRVAEYLQHVSVSRPGPR